MRRNSFYCSVHSTRVLQSILRDHDHGTAAPLDGAKCRCRYLDGKSCNGAMRPLLFLEQGKQDKQRTRGKEPKATKDIEAAKRKFLKGTIWKVSKVSLAKQNPKYMGCSCKTSIDMNTSKFEPVLHSTITMPMQAAPPEDLATLLECHEGW